MKAGRFFRIAITLLVAVVSSTFVFAQNRTDRLRVALLYEPSFPVVDGTSVQHQQILTALEGFEVISMSVDDIQKKLNSNEFKVLITPYGSAFPKVAAEAMFSYLRGGGSWVNLGGTPFSVPVVREGKTWRTEVPQTAYHKKLGITQSLPVVMLGVTAHAANSELDVTEDLLSHFSAKEVYELYVRFTSTKDYPDEDGSAGQRDAILSPLIWGLNAAGTKLAAPFVQIDRLQGEYVGGRWMLANFHGELAAPGVRALVERAMEGATEFKVRPSFACYRGAEVPSFLVQLKKFGSDVSTSLRGACNLEVVSSSGETVETFRVQLRGDGDLATGEVTMEGTRRLLPGLYSVIASQETRRPQSRIGRRISASSGFWMYDHKLMESGTSISTDGTYFLKNGEPYPVTGTTYMASDVARKFLFDPNPKRWDEDFSEMKRFGINMVRTGIWTGWKNIMLDVGSANETALRALDAFVLTARKHDIPVIFTFFAFLPETWGGANAYLDPRSVNAQKRFLQIITQRYSGVNDIIWDLINEPSFCNPHDLWNCRPNYDEFESRAWDKWLKERYPFPSDAERQSRLREMWRMNTEESLGLPPPDEFSDANIFDHRRPLRVIDYKLFAQDMFRAWVSEMTSAIRSNGNAKQLITVGQDEAGTSDSPNNQFMGDLLGFTSLHNWWLNDDLVWDNVVTKMQSVPNLVEETGVMFYEKMDGSAWRAEDDAARLLERKLAISFAAGGAGFIEWIWNINPFMKSDNEATIGLFRADGTMKPEFYPVTRYAKFFESNKHLMKGRRSEDVVMVIPHSNMFSTRNFATEATKRCVRVMSCYLGVPVSAVSEYGFAIIKDTPKLIVVPSAQKLTEACWQQLLELAEKGSTVLVTGPIDADEHSMPANRLKKLGIDAESSPVVQEEKAMIGDKGIEVSFRNFKSQRVEKSVEVGRSAQPREIPAGKGRIIWFPLPLENADNIEPTVALYRLVLDRAGVDSRFSVERMHPGVLILPTFFQDAILYTCVSEAGEDVSLKIADLETKKDIPVSLLAQRAVLFFLDRKSGKVLSRLD